VRPDSLARAPSAVGSRTGRLPGGGCGGDAAVIEEPWSPTWVSPERGWVRHGIRVAGTPGGGCAPARRRCTPSWSYLPSVADSVLVSVVLSAVAVPVPAAAAA